MRFEAFIGPWSIDRVIEDIRAARTGTFRGTAEFRHDDGALAYVETGEITLAGSPPMTASRAYRWSDGGDGSIAVHFEDGRFFHRFYADEARPTAAHDCPPDRYRVGYDFSRWPRWIAEWRVEGPRKNYVTRTTFRPAGQGGGFGA